MYDTITNQWSHLSTVPFVSFGQTSIVAYDNTIALFGGYYQNTGFPTEYLNCTCQYQISDDSWNCFSPHLTLSERKYGVSTVFDHHSNLIYILGGFGEDDLFSNKVNVFNPITNSMHNDTNLPNIGGGNLITSIMGRKMIVFGGWHATTRNIVKTSLIAKLISGHPTTQPPQTVPTHDSTVDAVYSKESGLVGEDIIILVSGCIIGVLLLFSVIYLLFFTAKRSREIGQISWTSFLKYSSVLLKITIVFGLLDSISHYIFATSLLGHLRFGEVHNASRITWMAWISLICGIVAFLLCICWLLVARKLYAKIPVLMKQLAQYQQIKDRSLNMDLRRDLLKEIRLRKVDIDIFGILIACLDITQITIILIVHKLWLKEWSTISIASLSLCFVSCSLKFVNIIIDGMGCGDDSMNVKHDTTHDRKGEHSDVAIAYEDDMDCMHEDLSDTDNIGHAAYERHISIIRSNVAGSEAESLVNEAFNVIQIQRNDHFKNDKNGIDHIIHNATTAMGIYHDEEEELGSRHIFLDGEGSPSQHSPQGQHNYIDL